MAIRGKIQFLHLIATVQFYPLLLDVESGTQKRLACSGFQAGGLLPKLHMFDLLHEIISRQ